MTFKLDFSQINNNNNDKKEFAKIQDGTYEVIIDSAKQDATPSGADFLDIRLRIRQDFNQSFKNQIIFYRIWCSKKDGLYPAGMLNTLAKAAGLADGTEYADVDGYLKEILGKPLKVTVKNVNNEYKGKMYERLQVKRIEESALATTSVELDDSDLPF